MPTRKVQLIITLFVIVLSGAGSWFYLDQSSNVGMQIETAVEITTFQAYTFADDQPSGFKLQPSTIRHEKNILLFELKNALNNKVVAVTEQRIPDTFDFEDLKGDKEFKTPYGSAYITDGEARTTGALFTDDKTWILMNAPQPIGADTMQSLINNLRPLKTL